MSQSDQGTGYATIVPTKQSAEGTGVDLVVRMARRFATLVWFYQ